MTNIILLDTCTIHDFKKIKERYSQTINNNQFAIPSLVFYELYQLTKNFELTLRKLESYKIPFLIINFLELIAQKDICNGKILDQKILLSKFSEAEEII